MSSLIKVGEILHLELNMEQDNISRYRSKVADLNNESIFIHFPVGVHDSKPHFFPEETRFKGWFLGKDDAIYLFESNVTGKLGGQIPVIVLKKPEKENLIRIQRRQYVRVDTCLDVAVGSVNNDFSAFTTTSLDLSGGGLQIVLPHDHSLSENMEVTAWLPLSFQSNPVEYVKAESKVIRIRNKNASIRASLKFITMEENERQKVIRFCYERQVQHRKKEMQLKK
ncbi:flagellar brake protein [Alteribacter populi]|uniref:flagellar brake protein n=1 Tax=Alteribacter populi TaxID=2011011 RepID=UPI001E5F46AD|nr:PilZ domain-containing protein [Alteribacter populi]